MPDKRGRMRKSKIENFPDWVRLVQSEFAEMPGLHLSRRQAQRLWNLDDDTIDVILDELVSSNFLKRTPGDVFIKADVGC
jgi:hypothetical protein